MSDPTYKNLARIKDNTNNVIFQIKATGLESSKTIAVTGDVTGSASTDLTQNVSIAATIANGAVTESKLATDAVTVNKITDGEITKAKLNANAYNEVDGTIADGTNANLATKTQVKAYVESVISSEGHYKGVQSVATINTWTAANLHNGDRVITSSAPEGSGTGTLTLGNLPVVDGQEVIFYVSDDQSTKIWQSSEGNYKIKQTAKSDPTVPTTGTTTSLSFIDTITQNENGEITATKKEMRVSSTSQTGIVQLKESVDASETDNSKAATPKAVRDAINDLDVTEVGGNGKIISAISEADGKISATAKTMDSAPTSGHTDTTVTSDGIKTALDAISSSASTDAEVVAESIDDHESRILSLEAAVSEDNIGERTADKFDSQILMMGGEVVKVRQTAVADPSVPVSGTTTSLSFIDTISQDENGKIAPTKKNVPDASTSQKGLVQLQDSLSDGVTNKAPTVNAVYDALAEKQGTLTWMDNDEVDALWAAAKTAALA